MNYDPDVPLLVFLHVWLLNWLLKKCQPRQKDLFQEIDAYLHQERAKQRHE